MRLMGNSLDHHFVRPADILRQSAAATLQGGVGGRGGGRGRRLLGGVTHQSGA